MGHLRKATLKDFKYVVNNMRVMDKIEAHYQTGMNPEDALSFTYMGSEINMAIANDNDEAIVLANKSEFGLGSAIFTRDIEKGESIAKTKLQSGACVVNDFVKSDPRLPFGGIKMSGYGRELSYYGLMEFVNIKTIVVKSPSEES